MGNVVDTFAAGFLDTLTDPFGSPIDFLTGKSCSLVCGQIWDFFCYIENFCVANLLKLAAISGLLYIVLLVIYILFRLRIFRCCGRILCRLIWDFIQCWISLWTHCCNFICESLCMMKSHRHRHRHRHYHRRDRSEFDTCEDGYELQTVHDYDRSIHRHDWKNHRRVRFRESLRPRSHRSRVGLRTNSKYGYGRHHHVRHGYHHGFAVNNVRVVQSSKFARKGRHGRRKIHSRV